MKIFKSEVQGRRDKFPPANWPTYKTKKKTPERRWKESFGEKTKRRHVRKFLVCETNYREDDQMIIMKKLTKSLKTLQYHNFRIALLVTLNLPIIKHFITLSHVITKNYDDQIKKNESQFERSLSS